MGQPYTKEVTAAVTDFQSEVTPEYIRDDILGGRA
jgi:hypothetical protein